MVFKMSKYSNYENTFHYQSLEELFKVFDTHPHSGLKFKEVKSRQTKYGLNELPKITASYWKIYIAPLLNFMILILIISSLIIMILGSPELTIITWVIIAINSIVVIIQQYGAQKALKSLNKISIFKAAVIREGVLSLVSNIDLVPGDIILIESGDKIPADGRIIESTDLMIDEALLTGESELAEKNNIASLNDDILISKQKCMVFMGTHVNSGRAKIIVTNTGFKTEIGKISYYLNKMGSIDDIPLVNKLNHLGHILGIGVIMNLIILILYKFLILSQNINVVLIDSIIRAMNLVPVNLPFVTTLLIITGILKMAQSGVIIKNFTSIESLGRVSIICSDKTGTITKNEMMVKKFWLGANEYEVSGSGYEGSGQILFNGDIIDLSKYIPFQRFIASIVVNNSSHLINKLADGNINEKDQIFLSKQHGRPTELALLILARTAGYDIQEIRNKFNVIREFPFTSELKKMSIICKSKNSNNSVILFSKGAAEIILNASTHIDINGKIERLNETLRREISDKIIENANAGYRILSISYKKLDDHDIKENRENIEKDLTFLGFVSILDAPRLEVKQSIKTCKQGGIKVLMITGDHPATSRTIAIDMGILDESRGEKVVEGINIKDFKKNIFNDIKVFSRINPTNKELIIEQYQKMNKIVAMTGDGINDVLALKKADIGIAMGLKGMDIAKESSDIILSDDNFSSIVKGVKIGRDIFSNIRVMIYFFICLNIMEGFIIIFYEFVPAINLFSSNWQIIYISTIIHGLISLGLILDKPPRDIMTQMPRNDEEILNKNIWKLLIIHAILMGFGAVLVFQLSLANYIPLNEFNVNPTLSYISPEVNDAGLLLEMKARTMFFTTLFIIETNFIWSIRRLDKPLFKSLKEDFNLNLFFICILTLSIHVFLVLFSNPVNLFINDIWKLNFQLNFLFLNQNDWLICILFSIPGIFGIEIIKFIARRSNIVF